MVEAEHQVIAAHEQDGQLPVGRVAARDVERAQAQLIGEQADQPAGKGQGAVCRCRLVQPAQRGERFVHRGRGEPYLLGRVDRDVGGRRPRIAACGTVEKGNTWLICEGGEPFGRLTPGHFADQQAAHFARAFVHRWRASISGGIRSQWERT
jgi:hypothetical protein